MEKNNMFKTIFINLFILIILSLGVFANDYSPQEVYENYLFAIKNENISEIFKYLDPNLSITQEELKSALPRIISVIPSNITYGKEIIVDNLALLYPEGDYYNPKTKNEETCRGVIKLKQIQNGWRVKNNYWKCSIL